MELGVNSATKQSNMLDCFALLAMTFIGFLLVSPASAAEDPLFSQANAKYQAGDFKQAAELYEKITDSKQASAAAHYNLGNALLRIGRKGQALVSYKRALAITPRDPDIEWNIHVLKSALTDRIEDNTSNILDVWFRKIIDGVTVDETALLLSFSIGVLCLLSVMQWVFPASKTPTIGSFQALLIVVLVASAVLFNLKWHDIKDAQVVVLDREVLARNGPSPDETKAFLLHEGAEASVGDESKDWYCVTLANKNAGWIPKESCEVV